MRKTGNMGQIHLPMNDGMTITSELSLVASKVIGEKTFENRFYGHSMTLWNKNKRPFYRIQGVASEAIIEIGSAADTLKVPNAVTYFRDIGAAQTAPAGEITVSRPAAGKKCWNLVVIDIPTGALSVVKGKDGDELTSLFEDPTGGAGGGLPFVGQDKLIIGGVKLTSSVSAQVQVSELAYHDLTGKIIQERADMPIPAIVPLHGGLLFPEPLLPSRAGGATRKVFATFTSQSSVLAPVIETTGWTLDGSRSVAENQAQGDDAPEKDFSGAMSWKISFSRFAVDKEMFRLCKKGRGFIKLYPDRDEPGHYIAAILLTGFKDGSEVGNTMKNDLSVEVDGDVEWRES